MKDWAGFTRAVIASSRLLRPSPGLTVSACFSASAASGLSVEMEQHLSPVIPRHAIGRVEPGRVLKVWQCLLGIVAAISREPLQAFAAGKELLLAVSITSNCPGLRQELKKLGRRTDGHQSLTQPGGLVETTELFPSSRLQLQQLRACPFQLLSSLDRFQCHLGRSHCECEFCPKLGRQKSLGDPSVADGSLDLSKTLIKIGGVSRLPSRLIVHQ